MMYLSYNEMEKVLNKYLLQLNLFKRATKVMTRYTPTSASGLQDT